MSPTQSTPPPSTISALGYLGFHAQDVEAWRSWATEVLGMQDVAPPPGAPSDHVYLRIDERAWRFAIEPADQGGIGFIGWETASPFALGQLERLLATAGVEFQDDPDLARLRGVDRLIRCLDPNGFRPEFYCGGFIPREPFISPLGVSFLTGDQGLGHILVTVEDIEATKRFYLDLLGFRISDFIEFSGNKVHFTHVNPRHHSLAFVQTASCKAALGHFMVEVNSLDDVGRALDRTHAGRWRVTETLGRHTNDHMLSFYCENPSGSQTEYGWGGRAIDEKWSVTTYHATALWGHKVPGTEYWETGPLSPR